MADDHSASHDKAFRAIRKVVLERDNHACQFCGFRAAKWQEVHHLNDDHADNRPENLITACWFCHMVHHIGRVGLFDEGGLIYAPELGDRKSTRLNSSNYRSTRMPYSARENKQID